MSAVDNNTSCCILLDIKLVDKTTLFGLAVECENVGEGTLSDDLLPLTDCITKAADPSRDALK